LDARWAGAVPGPCGLEARRYALGRGRADPAAPSRRRRFVLRVQVLQAVVYDHDRFEQTGEIDPAIVVRGEFPAHSRPFVVDRIFRGPQGVYDEAFALVAPDGTVLYHHDWARVTLRGQMYEDRFRDVVRSEVELTSEDELMLVLLMNRQEVGRIPVFVDAPESAIATGALPDAVEAALKKSTILWVRIPQPDGGEITRPAWFVHQDAKVYLLTGPEEQDLPNIAEADKVTLVVRSKEDRSQIGAIPSAVRVVDNDAEEFEKIGESAVSLRLNLKDLPDALERWKATATMVELTPEF
jgi:hypothetical protein